VVATIGFGPQELGCTVSRRGNILGLGGTLGGVRWLPPPALKPFNEVLLAWRPGMLLPLVCRGIPLFERTKERLAEVGGEGSSLVKVPCLTMPGLSAGDAGD